MDTKVKRQYPAMVNVGVMTTAQLNMVVSQFPEMNFTVTRGELVYKVRDIHGTEVVSAAILRPNTWHMRACDGLIQRVPI